MKTCKACQQTLPPEQYYRHPETADGLLHVCKSCHKRRMAERWRQKRETDPDWVEAERVRGREKYHRLGYVRSVRRRGTSAPCLPEQKRAYSLCQHVPCPPGYQRHHWSYREEHATDVLLLTQADHYTLHRYLTYSRADRCFRTASGELLDTRRKHEAYAAAVLAQDGRVHEAPARFAAGRARREPRLPLPSGVTGRVALESASRLRARPRRGRLRRAGGAPRPPGPGRGGGDSV